MIRAHRLEALFLLGRWEEVLEETDHVIAADKEHGRSYTALNAALSKAWALSLMGRYVESMDLIDSLTLGDPDRYVVLLSIPRIRAFRVAGRTEEAAKVLDATLREFEIGNPALEFLCGLAHEAAALERPQ